MNIRKSDLFVTKTEFNPELLYGGVAVRVSGLLKEDRTFIIANYIVIENTGNTLKLVGHRKGKEHLLEITIKDIEVRHLEITLLEGVFHFVEK